MPKLLLGIGLLTIVLVGGFFAFNNYIYNQKQAQGPEAFAPYRGTLSGEYVCLQPVNNQQAVECDYGIKTATNEFYALDFNLLSQDRPELNVGDRFTAGGTITPIENLSSSYWKKYDLEGIFSVTDSVQKL